MDFLSDFVEGVRDFRAVGYALSLRNNIATEKLSLLNLTGDSGPYHERQRVKELCSPCLPRCGLLWNSVELIFATKSLMALSILLTILMHGWWYIIWVIKSSIHIV